METLEFKDDSGCVVASLRLYPPQNQQDALRHIDNVLANEHGEEPLQLVEGVRYEYEISCRHEGPVYLEAEVGELGRLVEPSRVPGRSHTGHLNPGLYTGKLPLVISTNSGAQLGKATLEVTSSKLGYRNDYRAMMEEITERCVDLLFDVRSPSQARVTPDPGRSPATISQRFAFLKSMLGSRQFQDALHRITTYPHRKWEPEETIVNVHRGFRPNNKALRELAKSRGRTPLPPEHPLSRSIPSLPGRISIYRNMQTEDTPENRFVRFALESFVGFLGKMARALDASASDTRLKSDIKRLSSQLESVLRAEIFQGLSQPTFLPLGSPVLHRKEGYREVLQAWLRFDMAARLVWQGGDDVYGSGQRDIATLYEYWVFFRLLDLVSKVFRVDRPNASTLIEETADGFGLKLKSGRLLTIDGRTSDGPRPLNVRLSYNKSFSFQGSSSLSGSWTERMRPDYTLSIWPAEYSEAQAESQEAIAHIHFDAKYRVESIAQLFGKDDSAFQASGVEDLERDLAEEKQEQKEGRYKRADLLKMHAYRDAIRRTQGAYVLYPGDRDRQWTTYHELLPGIGAFPLRPGGGTQHLEQFLLDVKNHVSDRTTARERLTFHTYQVYKSKTRNESPVQLPSWPEMDAETGERLPPPAESQVIVGWYKGPAHLEWIRSAGLYNFRMDASEGSLRFSPEIASARYLLLHSARGETASGLLKIIGSGPRVFSAEALRRSGYPSKPTSEFYLVYEVEPAPNFEKYAWDYKEIPGSPSGRHSAWPFTIALDKLLMTSKALKEHIE